MTIHGRKHLDEILRELIASGEIDVPVNDAIAKHFLAHGQARVPAAVKEKIQKAFMATRFKAMAKEKKDVVSRQQVETLSFGGYLTLVRSRLKASSVTAADACRISEQALLGIETAVQDVFKASVQMITDIIEGFTIPIGVVEVLLKNTIAARKEGARAVVFPRADGKAKSIAGAIDAAHLAIAKKEGKTTQAAVDPAFLSKIKSELEKRGRADLLR